MEHGFKMPSLMVTISSKTERAFRESLKMGNKVGEGIFISMGIFMKENGEMMSKMVLEKCNIQMEIAMKELGVGERKMDKESISMLLAPSMMVIS